MSTRTVVHEIAESGQGELIATALGAFSAAKSREAGGRKWAGAQYAEIRRDLRTRAHDAYQLAREIRILLNGGDLG